MKIRIIALSASLLAAAPASALQRTSLDGLWDFRFEKDMSLEDVRMPDFAPDDKMPVPGCWDATSRYYNQRGTGCYRRLFDLASDTPNAFLVVEGFALRCRFWIDGREVGFSKLPWSKVEFATGPLKAGRHELVAAVDSIVDNTKVKLFWNFYDFYPSGGFYHGVWLEAQEKSCELRRVVVRTRDYRTGRVELEAQFAGKGAPSDFTANVSFDNNAAQPVAFKNRRATVEVPNFRLWSPDDPNLHTVSLSTPPPSPLTPRLSTRFGIRQVSTAKGRILLNGEPVYLKGVNRHESHYEFGGATPFAVMYEDIRNLKALGGNFLRGSHYPQCAALLDLCDELGVLVWEESLGWGNGPEQLEDPVFGDLQEEETRLMVRNSINHPSVVITGFLNEPYSRLPSCRKLVDRLVAAVRAEDSGHLVTYAANDTRGDISHVKTDIISYNTYPCWYNNELKTGTAEEMRANVRRCHEGIVKYFRDLYRDERPILVSEIGVKADFGVRDPRGKAQYTEDFQAEYTRIMLEEVFDNPDLAGVAIWQFTDCKTYTRTQGLRNRSYGVNTGGLYDLYRRPKMAVEEVRTAFARPPACLAPQKAVRTLTVTMEPGEHWWGLATGCGDRMPFDAQSSESLDICKDGYGNPYQSLLVSDRGRYIWSDGQVAMATTGGVMRVTGPDVRLFSAGTTLKEAFLAASKAHFPPSGRTPDLAFYAAPQYCTWIELTYRQNEEGILAYAKSMIDNGLPPGVLIIDDTWQAGYGNWRFEALRFRDPKGMVDKLHAMGFKVLLWMCPFVQSDSPAFRLLTTGIDPESAVRREKTGGLLRGEKWDSENPIERPAAVSWWNGQSALVDFTDPVGRDWFRGECDRLMRDYGVDGFKMDGGHLHYYSRGYRAHEDVSSGLQARAYGKVCLDYPLCEFRNAFGLAGQPIVERLNDKDHSWAHLRKCVTDMIAGGLLGYSFICPDMVGGGQWISFLPGSAFDPELFVRSCQMQALCGMMQFSASPWRVLDTESQEIVRRAVALRQRFVPQFVSLAKDCAKTGEPFLRALEYEFPNRGYAEVTDEFMVGDFLLVAPQLKKGAATREVVIPPGEWQADDGSVVRGPARITVKTPLTRLPHFTRVADVEPTGVLQEKAQALADLAVRQGFQGALQFCAFKDGRCIVDVWAGTMTTNAGAAKIDGHTLFPIFSTEKPLLATAVHRTVEQGRLGYDTKVSSVWPAFTGGGKENLTVRELLGYRSGMPDNKGGALFSPEGTRIMSDWKAMLDWFASVPPDIAPGTKQRYMAKSYGWAHGGLLEKIWRKPANEVLREQVLIPAGIENDFYFVCGDKEIPRIATVYKDPAFESMNDDLARRSFLPSAWAVSSARGIARFYNRLCGFDGHPPLVEKETLDAALVPCRHSSDPVPDVEGLKKWHMIFGMGYGLWGEADNISRVFGHGGIGGSEGLCDRSQRLTVGYTCNFGKAPPKLREAFYSLVGMRWRYWKDDVNIQDLQMATEK